MFSDKLLNWYDEFGRDLPWRKTNDPYQIWLSEIILQQTRIEQGRAYWSRFVERLPDIRSLALAPEEEVLKLWQGLGYYSRARNLHAAAKYIYYDLGGNYPDTYEEILKLKGVGRYTAAAIASFAFRRPCPVIDGNVYRLISRLFNISTPIGTDKAYAEFEQILLRLIDRDHPDNFNQALMDFGSTYCKPVSPDCPNCIFRQECMAHRLGKVGLLPVKGQQVKVKDRYLYYFDIQWQENGETTTLLQQRDNKDIWKGLYEFPLHESTCVLEGEALDAITREIVASLTSEAPVESRIACTLTHKLTHRNIHATFVSVILRNADIPSTQKWQKYTLEEVKNKPISRLIDRYLTKKQSTSF